MGSRHSQDVGCLFFFRRNYIRVLVSSCKRGLTVREVPGDWGMSPNKQALLYKRALLAGWLLVCILSSMSSECSRFSWYATRVMSN